MQTDRGKRRGLYALLTGVAATVIWGTCSPLSSAAEATMSPTAGSMMRGRVPYHTLTWAEFAVDDGAAGLSAQTQTYLTCRYSARATSGQTAPYIATVTQIAFDSGFDADHSWRRSSVRTDNDRLLHHEQGHLDINEIARRARQTVPLSALPTGSGDTAAAALQDLRVKLRAFYDSEDQALRRIQERYDEETNHGTQDRSQTDWTQRLQTALASPNPVPLSNI